MNPIVRKFLFLGAVFLSLFLIFRYFLPLFFPFLVGTLLAIAAEPIVRFGCKHLHLPRPLASGIGITVSFAFIATIVLLLAALLVRQLRELAGIVPDLSVSIRSGMDAIAAWLLRLAAKTPEGVALVLTREINDLFSGGSAMLDRATGYLLRLASGILSQVPGRALSFATAIIASFMISAKLPKIKTFLRARLYTHKLRQIPQTLGHLKHSLGGWLKAQLKLSVITFGIAAAGLLLLRIPRAPLWGLLIAVVDAFPILGTGSVLVPWSLVSFLQGDRLQAFGLLGLYGAATVLRSILEPRLVGRQLGIDPLITLVALYVGFRLFGLPGMIFAPIITVTVTQFLELKSNS